MKTAGRTLPAATRQYKDTVFRKLFSNETNLLHLYNAVMGTEYDRLDHVEITETENPIYIGMRNDVAFFADFHVHIYEHQSTINPNMPLRDLFYVAQLYGKYLAEKNLFSAKPVEIPAPSFIVFYNGRQKQPERMEHRKEVVTMSLWEFNQEKYDAMLLEEGEMRGRAEGKAEGRAEERVLLNRLTECLLEDDRLVELKASLQDASLQDKLLKEYCLA